MANKTAYDLLQPYARCAWCLARCALLIIVGAAPVTQTIRRQDTQRALLQEKVDAHEQQVEHLRRETARLQPAFSAVLGRELDPAMVVDDLDGARERRYVACGVWHDRW